MVFVKLYPSDTSYQTGGGFELPDGNLFIYGFSPEANGFPPLMIKTDSQGNVLWKRPLPATFHFCTIKPTAWGTLMAVGVENGAPDVINVCEVFPENGTTGPVKSYFVDSMKAGPELTPKFVIDSIGNLVIAGTLSSNDSLKPFILPIDAAGNADPYRTFDLGAGEELMAKGISQDEKGFTISGSTFYVNNSNTPSILSYCLRLDLNYNEEWTSILTNPSGYISTTGATENESSDAIFLYGSVAAAPTANNFFGDLVGQLYTQKIDMTGNLVEQNPYYNYENLGHVADLSRTNDGFVLLATTNELYDFHVVSSNHIYLLKLDGSGHEEWHNQFNGSHPLAAVSVSQTMDGGYLVVGYEHTGTLHYTMCLIRTDDDGKIVTQ